MIQMLQYLLKRFNLFSKRFTILEKSGYRSLVSKSLEILLLNPEMGVQIDLPSATKYISGGFHVVVAIKSHMGCMGVHKRFQNK